MMSHLLLGLLLLIALLSVVYYSLGEKRVGEFNRPIKFPWKRPVKWFLVVIFMAIGLWLTLPWLSTLYHEIAHTKKSSSQVIVVSEDDIWRQHGKEFYEVPFKNFGEDAPWEEIRRVPTGYSIETETFNGCVLFRSIEWAEDDFIRLCSDRRDLIIEPPGPIRGDFLVRPDKIYNEDEYLVFTVNYVKTSQLKPHS